MKTKDLRQAVLVAAVVFLLWSIFYSTGEQWQQIVALIAVCVAFVLDFLEAA